MTASKGEIGFGAAFAQQLPIFSLWCYCFSILLLSLSLNPVVQNANLHLPRFINKVRVEYTQRQNDWQTEEICF